MQYKKETFHLALWLCLLHALYFCIALVYGKIGNADTSEYLNLAANIRHHLYCYSGDLSKGIDPGLISLRPPLYGFFIALVGWFSSSFFAVLLVQNVLSITLFVCLYRLMMNYQSNTRAWIWIVVAFVLFPTGGRLANSLLSDHLLQVVVFASFLSLVNYFENRKMKFLLLYHLLITTALFVKPALIYFWVPNVLFSFYLYYLNRRPAILLFALILPLSVFFWCLRNQKETGYFHFSSIASQNIVECYSYNALLAKYGKEHADSIRRSIVTKARTIPDFKQRCEYLNHAGVGIIRDNLGTYAWVHVRGMFAFMLDPGRYDIVSFFPYNPVEMSFFNEVKDKGWFRGTWYYITHIPILLIGYLTLIFLWNLVLFASLLFFIFNKKVALLLRLAVFLYVGYFCSVSVIVQYARYRNAILPILIFTLPFFFSLLRDWWIRKKQTHAHLISTPQ